MTHLTKLGLAIIALLLLMPLSWRLAGIDPSDIDPHRPWELRKPDPKIGQAVPIIPRPMGPKDAPVQIQVFLSSDSDCDHGTVPAVRDIVRKHEGKVRAEFVDMVKPEGQMAAESAKISCKSGITINGKSEFRLPGGNNRVLQLNGPVGEHNYSTSDLQAIVEYVLRNSGSGSATAPKSK